MNRELTLHLINSLVKYLNDQPDAFIARRSSITNVNGEVFTPGEYEDLIHDADFWQHAESKYLENRKEPKDLAVGEINLQVSRTNDRTLVSYGLKENEISDLSLQDTFILEAVVSSARIEAVVNYCAPTMEKLDNDEITLEEYVDLEREARKDLVESLNFISSFLESRNSPLSPSSVEGNTLTLENFSASNQFNHLSLLNEYILATKTEIENKLANSTDPFEILLCEKGLSDLDYVSQKIEKTPPVKETDFDFIMDFTHKTKQLCLEPNAENLAEYFSLKDSAAGKGSWGKMIGGLALTTLSLLIIAVSVIVAAASLGASTPLSALGIAIATDLLITGTAALVATAGVVTAVSGVSIANLGRNIGFFKHAKETIKLTEENLDLEQNHNNNPLNPRNG